MTTTTVDQTLTATEQAFHVAHCAWCRDGHRRVKWWGQRELKCHDCGRRTPHQMVRQDDLAVELRWYLTLFEAVTISLGTAQRDHSLSVSGSRTIGGTPQLKVVMANDLAPWGMLGSLKTAWKFLGNANKWNSSWYPEDTNTESVQWAFKGPKTARSMEDVEILEGWAATNPYPWIRRWQDGI